MKRKTLTSLLAIALSAGTCFSQGYVPAGAEKYLYKSTPNQELAIWVVKPDKPFHGEKSPAIVFFFGGGWNSGSVKQFETQAHYLADRGMTAFLVEYRTKTSAGTTPFESVADAKSAMRHIRANARRFGIDPSKIAASGGSAGGHLAAAAACVTAFDDPGDDTSVSAAPNALVLFNPVVDSSSEHFEERLGDKRLEFSPMHNVTAANVRPTLLMVGSEDTLTPASTAEEYARVCRNLGGRCDLEIYEGASHGFFNPGRAKNSAGRYFYDVTVERMDDFLVSLGYLPAKK
jgi:acetyl esterase/lipase